MDDTKHTPSRRDSPRYRQLRAAKTLVAKLTEFGPDFPDLQWRRAELRKLLEKMERFDWAVNQGWESIAYRLGPEIQKATEQARRSLQPLVEDAQWPEKREIPTIGQVFLDLVALGDEFDEMVLDLRKKTISVRTEEIELEGLELGAFEIKLNYGVAAEDITDLDICLKVIALNPEWGDEDSLVAHPHVKDGVVCLGKGSRSAHAALAAGRLLDLFSLIDSLLKTYNGSSAHVKIEDWLGGGRQACGTCRHYANPDDLQHCDGCEKDVCPDCWSSCRICRESMCATCSSASQCRACDEWACSGCVSQCAGCSRNTCHDCLDKCSGCDTVDLCSRCRSHHCRACDATDLCRNCIDLGECAVCRKEESSNPVETEHAPVPAESAEPATAADASFAAGVVPPLDDLGDVDDLVREVFGPGTTITYPDQPRYRPGPAINPP